MKILQTPQLKEADQITIKKEPISSIDLMERAANKCADWFSKKYASAQALTFICGVGNNGGDGLAMARILHRRGYDIEVFIIGERSKASKDFEQNFNRILTIGIKPKSLEDVQEISTKAIIIDAIFGTGLSRPLEGEIAKAVQELNQLTNEKISIDLPTGIKADETLSANEIAFKADFTLTIGLPKIALLLPENGTYIGNWELISIGINQEYIDAAETQNFLLDHAEAKEIYKPAEKFSHKGSQGKALIIAGSRGKMGAAVMASKACMKAGTGLLETMVPTCGVDILQITHPESMVLTNDGEDLLVPVQELPEVDAIGIGPGIGKAPQTLALVEQVLKLAKKPMVIDADALNIISENPSLLKLVPEWSILTPHPKEFTRLCGNFKNDLQKLELLRQFCAKYKVVMLIKGAHTAICIPGGTIYFNTTGNPGMATAGAGDVLTGLITGLMAQGYSPQRAAIFGVYIHGLAGDIAAKKYGKPSMQASDIIEHIGEAYLSL